jgi:hypothetical protein
MPRSRHLDTSPTALYRLYDESGALLYVGITNMPNVRFATHSLRAWWSEVARKEIEWHPDRRVAEAFEIQAIGEERPRYNAVHAKEAPALPPLAEPVDALEAEVQAAALRRHRLLADFHTADAELRATLRNGRAAGKGPSHMARLSGFTREWVAQIAPARSC